MMPIVLQAGAIYALQKGLEYLSNHAPAEKIFSEAELTTIEKVHTVFSYSKGSAIVLVGKENWRFYNDVFVENWALAHLLSLSIIPSPPIDLYFYGIACMCLVLFGTRVFGGIGLDAVGYPDLAKMILPTLTKRISQTEDYCLEEVPTDESPCRMYQTPTNVPSLADDNPLNEFICPLKRRQIRYIVTDKDKISYEKDAILKHLEKEWISPVSGKFLSPSDLVDMVQSEFKLEDLRDYMESIYDQLNEPVSFDIFNFPAIPDLFHKDVIFRLFKCPITREPIRDPVGDPTDRDVFGYPRLYERNSLLEVLGVNGNISPITKQPLVSMDLIEQPRILALIENRLTFYQEQFNQFLQGDSSLNQLVVPPPPQALLAAAKAENSRYF